jgi:hypothetical protein
VPLAVHAAAPGDRTLLVLEDLDAAGFGERRRRVSETEVRACLDWLAAFHATFLGQAAREHAECDMASLEAEWRALYPIACADFYRFLLGWARDADARDSYLDGVTRRVLASL